MSDAGLEGQMLKLKEARLCLDFSNTAEWHASAHPDETLTSYTGLVRWAQTIGLLTDTRAQQLQRRAEEEPAQAAAVLARAITLREAIYGIFSAIAHGKQPQPADLATLNSALSQSLSALHIVADKGGFRWAWVSNNEALDSLLRPVAHSAADLLTSADVSLVGQCADDRGCGWLFLDASRNHSRRWCAMKDCGNRAKAQRHYQRQRTGAGTDGETR